MQIKFIKIEMNETPSIFRDSQNEFSLTKLKSAKKKKPNFVAFGNYSLYLIFF